MSNEATIIQAAKDYFEAMNGRAATVWANQKAFGGLPRVEFLEGPVAAQTPNLAGDSRGDFMFQATIVTKAGTSSAEADAMAQTIIARFRVGTRIGEATVITRPVRGAGFPDGGEWRLPVTVRMVAQLDA